LKFPNWKVTDLKVVDRLFEARNRPHMAGSRRIAFIAGLALATFAAPARLPAQSLSEGVEAIDKARVTTRILFITAHPDDEASGLLVYLSRGLDADVALMTLTRGQGGQNAIGPEQGAQLGMLRTEELLGASHHNGVTQFFSRAPDFGFSKSPDQTLKIWGDVPLEDMVRVIRTFRPDIVINGWGGVHWGHGQHQASGILTPQAVVAAADAHKFPNQIQEGLSPWSVSLVLDSERDEVPSGYLVPLNDVSPVWGKSYNEMGRESLVYHRSQGVTMFADSPFFRRPQYLIVEPKTSGGASNASLSRQVLANPLPDLAKRYPSLEAALRPALQSVDQRLGEARQMELALDRTGSAAKLAQAALQIQELQKGLAEKSGDQASAAAWEIGQVRNRIDLALQQVIALPIRVRAERNEVVAGESFSLNVDVAGTPAVPVQWSVAPSGPLMPKGWSATPDAAKSNASDKSKSAENCCKFVVSVPSDATPPATPGDLILPWPPPLVQVPIQISIDGYDLQTRQPAVAVVATSTNVDSYPLELVPAISLSVEPRHVMLPAKAAAGTDAKHIELLARVRNHGTRSASVSVGMDVPEGWSLAKIPALEIPASSDQLVRFDLALPPHAQPGSYPLKPFARVGNRDFRISWEPLPSRPTLHWSEPVDASVDVLDLDVPENLHIGYVTAGTDPIPETLSQLGIRVDLLDEVALAFDDLSHYDAIIVGIRGYELRPDAVRSNSRLMDYVEHGGTLLVQYERDFAWQKSFPPFPASMGEHAARVTDPNSPVRFLLPESPLLNYPNKISLEDFKGWVQERGLYFWGEWDSRYHAVLGLKDFGEPEVTGGLVTAADGKGVYIYTGLSFFRELPAGVPGAYRLFVNLISQSRLHAARN
jgi:LmbE family N-acetylglucosaminyl deacetylase